MSAAERKPFYFPSSRSIRQFPKKKKKKKLGAWAKEGQKEGSVCIWNKVEKDRNIVVLNFAA